MVKLIKWTGIALEYTGKALAQSDLDDALQELVREGLDRWFEERSRASDDADTKLSNREQIETLVSDTKSAAFRLAMADAVSGVAPVLASMLARRTRPDRVSFVPNRIVVSAIRKYLFERLSRSAEMAPLQEKKTDSMLYDLLSADSLIALRNAARNLPIRVGWFTFRKKWGYPLGYSGDHRIFLIGYDDTFNWRNSKGMFFTFQQDGTVEQVEKYINQHHQKLTDDIKRTLITLAEKSDAARTSIMVSWFAGVDSIFSDGYSTHQYFEKDPDSEVYSDADRVKSLYR